ncbi:hypothetical protein EVAR_98214_1 [Eumeta japonica]|uniref:Uncharacterized protein n=1 Tax=Eumeta variegata TaxID=151549 RepID=A0A4C1Y6V2_EUMVA|nr:hypothetical protein EVAR_98214_1 [Eumeta japonica]
MAQVLCDQAVEQDVAVSADSRSYVEINNSVGNATAALAHHEARAARCARRHPARTACSIPLPTASRRACIRKTVSAKLSNTQFNPSKHSAISSGAARWRRRGGHVLVRIGKRTPERRARARAAGYLAESFDADGATRKIVYRNDSVNEALSDETLSNGILSGIRVNKSRVATPLIRVRCRAAGVSLVFLEEQIRGSAVGCMLCVADIRRSQAASDGMKLEWNLAQSYQTRGTSSNSVRDMRAGEPAFVTMLPVAFITYY